MKHFEIRNRVRDSYDLLVDELRGRWPGRPLPGYEQAVRHRSQFESCGRLLPTSHGHEVYHWCRRPVCPTCSTHWGRALGRGLVKACHGAAKDEFRMATLVVAVVADPDGAFDAFKVARKALSNAVAYRRRTKGLDRAGWRSFGLAGALEVDMFLSEDFGLLGVGKQEQYRAFGFDPHAASGPRWVVTIHALVRVGVLGDETVRDLLQSVATVVHLQALRDDQTLVQAAEGICGYAAKVQITTGLAGGETRAWPLDALKDYIASTSRCSHGRQSFRLLIKPQVLKPKSRNSSRAMSESITEEIAEAMPIVL